MYRSVVKLSAEIKHDDASRFMKVCIRYALKFLWQVQVLYYVYCVAEDDELLGGCWQRDPTESPSCDNNQATQNTVQRQTLLASLAEAQSCYAGL